MLNVIEAFSVVNDAKRVVFFSLQPVSNKKTTNVCGEDSHLDYLANKLIGWCPS